MSIRTIWSAYTTKWRPTKARYLPKFKLCVCVYFYIFACTSDCTYENFIFVILRNKVCVCVFYIFVCIIDCTYENFIFVILRNQICAYIFVYTIDCIHDISRRIWEVFRSWFSTTSQEERFLLLTQSNSTTLLKHWRKAEEVPWIQNAVNLDSNIVQSDIENINRDCLSDRSKVSPRASIVATVYAILYARECIIIIQHASAHRSRRRHRRAARRPIATPKTPREDR